MDVAFKGACTVDRAEEFRVLLVKALAESTKVRLDFADVADADLSFFQLIHAAVKTFAAQGKELILTPNLPAALKAKAEKTDLALLVGAE